MGYVDIDHYSKTGEYRDMTYITLRNRNMVFVVIIKRVNTRPYKYLDRGISGRELYSPELLYVMKIWYWFISKWLNVYRGPFIKDVINQEEFEGLAKK